MMMGGGVLFFCDGARLDQWQVGVENIGYYLPLAVGLLFPNFHKLAIV
jgi:hypothetical protein